MQPGGRPNATLRGLLVCTGELRGKATSGFHRRRPIPPLRLKEPMGWHAPSSFSMG